MASTYGQKAALAQKVRERMQDMDPDEEIEVAARMEAEAVPIDELHEIVWGPEEHIDFYWLVVIAYVLGFEVRLD